MTTIRVGNAPVSWGVYEASRPTNPPFGQVLDAIAAAGYDGTELGPYGYLPTSPEALARELSARNLALGSSYVGMPLVDPARRDEAVQAALEVGRLLATRGVRELICAGEDVPERQRIAGRVPEDGSAGLSDRAWKDVAQTLHAVARALSAELGMRVVVHHHAGTFIETTGEIARLLHETDPALVGLLLDTGHAVYGGADPLALIERHGPRIQYVHFKDVKPSELERVRATDIPMGEAWQRGVFCPLGEGSVDFPQIAQALRRQGYEGWVIVEQDVVPDARGRLAPDPFESARQSRRYLREEVGL